MLNQEIALEWQGTINHGAWRYKHTVAATMLRRPEPPTAWVEPATLHVTAIIVSPLDLVDSANANTNSTLCRITTPQYFD